MADTKQPVTLLDLLGALGRSGNLKPLARECGLTVRELRRRLQQWRQEVAAEVAGDTPASEEQAQVEEGSPARSPGKQSEAWPDLTPAAELQSSPLPRRGRQVLEAWTDGASKGNPGPAAIGVVFRQKDGEALCSHSEAIGTATNNVAEYQAVLRALEFCRQWRIKQFDLYVDSELIARQLTGVYRVKSQLLLPLYQQAAFMARGLRSFRVFHVAREHNHHADHLANLALRRRPSRRR